MPDSQAASMDGPKDSEAAEPVTMQQFRERYRRSRENHRRYIAEHGIEAMEKNPRGCDNTAIRQCNGEQRK